MPKKLKKGSPLGTRLLCLVFVVGSIGALATLARPNDQWGHLLVYADDDSVRGSGSAIVTRSQLLFNPTGTPINFEVTPGCGCTTVTPSKGRVGPFGFTTLKEHFDLSAIQAGLSQKDVTITFTSGKETWMKQLSTQINNQ